MDCSVEHWLVRSCRQGRLHKSAFMLDAFIETKSEQLNIGASNEITTVERQRSEYRLQSAGLGIRAQPTEVGTLNAVARPP